jgi:PsbP-like protein
MLKKNMYPTFFLLAYILIFYNLSLIQYFDVDIYSQNSYSNTKIKQDITNSTSSSNSNDKWLYYTDKKENFTTIYPNGWEIVKSKNNDNNQTGHITIFRSPKENLNDTFQENIVISITKPNRDTSNNNNDFEIQTIVKKLATNNNDFKLENISNIDINGHHSGKGIEYSFKKSGIDFKTEQIFSTISDRIYIFSLLTEQKSFENYHPILKFMLKNLYVKNNTI